MIEADRSALFLICSDQLNPSPKSKESLGQLLRSSVLTPSQRLEDAPRPLTDGAEDALVETLPLALPDPPVLTSRRAFAPKLIRLANGDVGDIFGSASPSSTAFSFMEEVEGELPLPKLLWRFLILVKAEVWVGDAAIPSEAMEVRRRC